MSCYYIYKEKQYKELDDLYPVLLGEMEEQAGVVKVENGKETTVKINTELFPDKRESLPLVSTGFTNHSGGAYGGDTFWDIIGREFGVTNHKHYRDAGNTSLSQQLRNKGIKAEILTEEQMNFARQKVKELLGIEYKNDLRGNLQVRNFYQVYNADAVYAIATPDDKPNDYTSVKGGTNTAIQLAIKLGKPVYLWSTISQKWYKYEVLQSGLAGFVQTETPVLTKNFAGIGTRNIENYNIQKDGKWQPRKEYLGDRVSKAAQQAIRDVYEKTFKKSELKDINKSKIEKFKGFWTREQVAKQTDKIFLFGDNTNDRTITKYIPSTTQAVIRGLPNAIGIDTKKDRGTSDSSYFTDNDFEQFKNQVDEAIKTAKNTGKTIVIPADGIGTGKAMLKEKAPKLFEYLQQELNKLKETKNVEQSKKLFTTKINQFNYSYNPATQEVIHNAKTGDKVETNQTQINKVLVAYAKENNFPIQSFNKQDYVYINGKVLNSNTGAEVTNPKILTLFNAPIPVTSFSEFSSNVSLTDEDIEQARRQAEASDFLIGKTLLLRDTEVLVAYDYDYALEQEVLTIENINNAKDIKRISEANLIKLLAINNKYQQYINNEIEQEPEVVEAEEERTVVLPKTKEELDTLIQFPYQSASTDAPLKFKEVKYPHLKEFGFNENQSSFENIKAILTNISLVNDNPIKAYLAEKYLEAIDKFKNLEILIDEDMSSRGKVTLDSNSQGLISSIRINPKLITSKESFVETMMEEFTHAIVTQEVRNPNSEEVKRLKDLQQQAIAHFGVDNFVEYKNIIDRRKELFNKKRYGIELTEEETTFLETQQIDSDTRRFIYRLSNFDEFVAGILMDEKFQNYIDGIKEVDTNKSLWQKFIDIVLKIVNKFGISTDGLLKYALHDSLMLVQKAKKNNSALGTSLQAKYVRTTDFVNNKLGLKNEEGKLIPIKNSIEVAHFINKTFSNLAAINNPETNTIQIFYKEQLSKDVLDSLASYDAEGLGFFDDSPAFISNVTDYINSQDEDGIKKQFNLQAKTYLINLNDRLNSLHKSKTLTENSDLAPYLKQDKLAKIDIEIEKTRENINRIIKPSDVKISNLYALMNQGYQELNNISAILNKDMNSSDVIYAIQTVNFWRNAKKYLFIPNDYANVGLKNDYGKLELEANKVFEKVDNLIKSYVLNNVIKKHTSFKGTVEDLAKEFVDLSDFRVQIDDLNVVKSPLLQAIGLETKKQNEKRQKELNIKTKELQEATEKALPFLKNYTSNKHDLYEIFRQKDRFGRDTKNIVTRYSHVYNKEKKRALDFVYKTENAKGKEEAYQAYKFLKENTEQVDYKTLFPLKEEDYNEESFNKEYERLKTLMGTNHFNEWFAKQKQKIDQYKESRKNKVEYLIAHYKLASEEEIATNIDAKRSLDIFEEANSIYKLQEKLEKDSKVNPFILKYNYQSFKYLEDIAKKEITIERDNKSFKVPSYDAQYKEIEKNAELLNYYNKIFDILKYVGTLIPFETGEKIAINGIPEFNMEMSSIFFQEGMGAGFDAVKETWANMLRTKKNQNNTTIDVVTGKEKKNVRVGLHNTKSQINDELTVRLLKAKHDNINVTEEMKEDWRSEITEKYAHDMNFDLSSVLQMYLTLGIAYKHKAVIEDNVKLAQLMLNSLKEYQRDNKGELKRDTTNINAISYLQKEQEESFLNSKKLVEHTVNSLMYGESRKIDLAKEKKLTKIEKRHKEELESLLESLRQDALENKITREEFDIAHKRITAQIENLGAYYDKQKLWDLPLRWTQYKGMGWNVVGGISNMIFGTASNLIEGEGNQLYNNNDLGKAYGKVLLNSSLRNATFNKASTNEALKIRALMDNFDIMAESGREFKSLVGATYTEKMKWLSAFNVNARTEYINQAPLMLVMLDKTKFEHEGKEYSLYEGFDNAGNWNETKFGKEPEELITKTILKVKALIQRNHGNYNPMSPMLAKKTALGRLLMQFRSWMVEGYRTRFFDKEARYDEILETTVKGRYISAIDMFKNDWKGTSLALAQQVIKDLLPYSNSWLKNWTPLDKYVDGNGVIKDYDIANMKRVAMEMSIYIGLYTTVLALKALASDWDDDDPKKYAVNLLLNQGTRLRTDVLLYLNPLEAQKLIQDPIPSIKIITDFSKWTSAVSKTIIDGSPEYETGTFRGHNRILRTTLGLFPLVSQPYRTGSNVWQVFDEK